MKLHIVGIAPYPFIKSVYLLTCIFANVHVRFQFDFFCEFNADLEQFCKDVLNERRTGYECQGQSHTILRYNNRQLQINKYFFIDENLSYIPLFIQDLITQKTINIDEYNKVYIKAELDFFK